MGTKLNPGEFDCYRKAAPDEPLFVLRAKDPAAPGLVEAWRMVRADDFCGAVKALLNAYQTFQYEVEHGSRTWLSPASEKSLEARRCAADMQAWFLKHVRYL